MGEPCLPLQPVCVARLLRKVLFVEAAGGGGRLLASNDGSKVKKVQL